MKLRTRTRSPRRVARVGIAAATTLATVDRPGGLRRRRRRRASADADTLTGRRRGRRQGRTAAHRRPLQGGDRHAVKLVELPYAGLYDRISSELGSGSATFDVAALDAIWLSAFADGVAPLDDLFTDEVKDDLFGGLVAEAQVERHVRRHAGLDELRDPLLPHRPLRGPDETRPTSRRSTATRSPPPTDWEQYRDVAEFFTRDTDGDGQIDLYGTDVKGAVETEWLATVSQAGEEHMVLDAESGEVTIADAEHLAALDFYTACCPYRPDRRGAARLGGCAEPLLPGQPRDDAVLGPRLPRHARRLRR